MAVETKLVLLERPDSDWGQLNDIDMQISLMYWIKVHALTHACMHTHACTSYI